LTVKYKDVYLGNVLIFRDYLGNRVVEEGEGINTIVNPMYVEAVRFYFSGPGRAVSVTKEVKKVIKELPEILGDFLITIGYQFSDKTNQYWNRKELQGIGGTSDLRG
jgi:CRISPR/Cas system-associated exonuclease Cas4 (RecB family)